MNHLFGMSVVAVMIAGTAEAQSATTAPAPEQAAIFKAAGFAKRGNEWRSDCGDPGTDTYASGAIDLYKDVNGDGRPEAIVTEGSAYCYGNTGTAFWLLARQPNGAWKLVTHDIGIPQFLKTKGTDSWPDISIGGPGFCLPVQRWNGKAYVLHRKEYEGRPCATGARPPMRRAPSAQ
jgi:hypothetical protein